eukprot:GHVN01053147.1.p1 GENE.GHVN01053147.1~~GHVN01053147.1.p1  ORF type:complete len:343 (+),score=51.00 GHVN01053147.1:67-1095(+)
MLLGCYLPCCQVAAAKGKRGSNEKVRSNRRGQYNGVQYNDYGDAHQPSKRRRAANDVAIGDVNGGRAPRNMTAFTLTPEEVQNIRANRKRREQTQNYGDENSSGDVGETNTRETKITEGKELNKLDLSLDEIMERNRFVGSKQPRDFDPTSDQRPEVLHICDANDLWGAEAHRLFEKFELHHIEKVDRDGTAFNVVFNDPDDAWKALSSLAQSIPEDSPWWRFSVDTIQDFPSCEHVILRLGTVKDVHQRRRPSNTAQRRRVRVRGLHSRHQHGYGYHIYDERRESFSDSPPRTFPEYVSFDNVGTPEEIGQQGAVGTWGNTRGEIMDESRVEALEIELGIA